MITVPFVKYTSYGNNFVILDESQGQLLTEAQKSEFAFHATNTHFGVGCDNLLVLQPCNSATLAEINRAHDYWETDPDPGTAQYLFRMFEPNGDEAYSCGNGLISVADYLNRRYGSRSARVMTELPLESQRVLEVSADARTGTSSANLGQPRRVPEALASPVVRKQLDERIDLVEHIDIRFRANDLKDYTEHTSLKMTAYMVFTGEPHLVIFPFDSFSEPQLAEPLFAQPRTNVNASVVRRRLSLGTWLVRRIGTFLNEQFRSYFPSGINVCFARVDQESGCVEYRCFERGINRETLACGTGAVAVAVVAEHLMKLRSAEITILPHLCRRHDISASMQVASDDEGAWSLTGRPIMLVDGSFCFESRAAAGALADVGEETMDLLLLEEQLLGSTTRAAAH